MALNLNLVGSRMLPALENGLPTGFVDCETGNECSDCQRLRELVHAFTSLRLPLVQLPVIFFYLKKNLRFRSMLVLYPFSATSGIRIVHNPDLESAIG